MACSVSIARAAILSLLVLALHQSVVAQSMDGQFEDPLEQSRGFRDSCHDASTVRPNILLIMLDDLGFGDISATTGQFPTPHMDSLYENGIQLNHHYVHLMCSPSRTQFITGRYAMNLGYGEFLPWNNMEPGGIPIGQPTLANWLSEFGEYTTYGVGKWHLGYASTQLTPKANGFQHFFGFYQGAIDYLTKVYNDIEDGAESVYDFFEDEDACYQVIDSGINTMDLYSHKIHQYLDAEGQKVKAATLRGEVASPFFMMATLQSMHAPFPVLDDYEQECRETVSMSSSTQSEDYRASRQLYCELTLMTDSVVGEIIDSLRSNGLYGNTLIIFTADNGGDTDNGASNYPFRGTKGEFYEGNTRVITSISGGIIEKKGLSGTMRDELFSNLDWTPTLLQFAGYLDCIDPRDYSWDGRNQYDAILNTPQYDRLRDSRKSLILNIGDAQLRSARITVEHEGKRYKYLKSDNSSALDRWIYSGRLSDVWTVPDYGLTSETEDGKALPGLRVIEYNADSEQMSFSQHYHDAFLFDLSADPSELYNLLHPTLGHYDEALNAEIVSQCDQLLAQFLIENVDELFCPPLDWLHQRPPSGDPKYLDDGKFVRPFLSDKEYRFLLTEMFADDDNSVPQKLQDLYLTPWVVPERTRSEELRTDAVSASISDGINPLGHLKGNVMVPMILGFCVVAIEVLVIAFFRYRVKPDDVDQLGVAGEWSARKVNVGYGSME